MAPDSVRVLASVRVQAQALERALGQVPARAPD
jgi:hypothetical protein